MLKNYKIALNNVNKKLDDAKLKTLYFKEFVKLGNRYIPSYII